MYGRDIKCKCPSLTERFAIPRTDESRWSPSSGEAVHPSYFDRADLHLEERDEFIQDFWVRKYSCLSASQ